MKFTVKFFNLIERHKTYAFVFLFILWIAFIDDSSIYKRYQIHKESANLKDELRNYQELYKQTTRSLHTLESSKAEIENIARKQYFMKRADEDVYIVGATSSITTSIDDIYGKETE